MPLNQCLCILFLISYPSFICILLLLIVVKGFLTVVSWREVGSERMQSVTLAQSETCAMYLGLRGVVASFLCPFLDYSHGLSM